MADILWHMTAEQTSGWPDAPHTRNGSPGEESSLGYLMLGFSGLYSRRAAFYSEFFCLVLIKFNSFVGKTKRKKDEKEIENSSFPLISLGQYWLSANGATSIKKDAHFNQNTNWKHKSGQP